MRFMIIEKSLLTFLSSLLFPHRNDKDNSVYPFLGYFIYEEKYGLTAHFMKKSDFIHGDKMSIKIESKVLNEK